MRDHRSNYLICRCTVAFIWLYHGLVPKLLGPHSDELAMNMAIGLDHRQATLLAYTAGVGEIIFGALILLFWRKRWPLALSAAGMTALLCFALIFQPTLAMAAFNPVTMNICVLALSIVAYRLHKSPTT